MGRVIHRATVEWSCVLTISEVEIRALDALVGYGDDAFLKAFGDKLGTAYMRTHEAGLRSFFSTVREQVLPALSDIDIARRDLLEAIRRREAERQQRLLEAPK
jgi:hypothetical protein